MDCRSCAEQRSTIYRAQKLLRLFPPSGPPQFIAIYIVGPLPRTSTRFTNVVFMTDRFSKLTRSIPLRPITSPYVATSFADHWIIPYGVLDCLLSDQGPQFFSKLFATMCTLLVTKHFTTTPYQPQINGQVERFYRILVARLRHFFSEYWYDWDSFVQPLTYAYKMQVHLTTGLTPFDPVLSRHPPSPTIVSVTSAADNSPTIQSPTEKNNRLRVRIRSMIVNARQNL